MVESSEQSVATPGSATGSNNTRNSAPKDKKCRYCGQAFTSSSLGRHLDLYIKAKNPKPPDGIHKIEEIRRLRGSVTRRHTRISTKSETPKTPPVAASSPDAHHENQLASNASAPTEAVSEGGIEFNRMDWQATGVINGLPPRTTVDAGVEPSRNVSRHRQLKSGLEQRQVSSEDQVMLKATQLALKEVLWSIKEATSRATRLDPFEFNPLELNFPSLCLHILPSPATLFSPTPFPTADSWSINAPGERQFEALKRVAKERMLSNQRNRQQPAQNSGESAEQPSSTPTTHPPLWVPAPRALDAEKILSHIGDAYAHWTSLTDRQRDDAWQLEILRSFVRAEDQRKTANRDLVYARRQQERRDTQVTGLNTESHWSNPLQSANLTSAIPWDLDTDFARDGFRTISNTPGWDYERLIERWRVTLLENRQATLGLGAQRRLSDTHKSPPSSHIRPGSLNSKGTVMASAQHEVNTALPPSAANRDPQPMLGSAQDMPSEAAPQLNGNIDQDSRGANTSTNEGSSDNEVEDEDADADIEIGDADEAVEASTIIPPERNDSSKFACNPSSRPESLGQNSLAAQEAPEWGRIQAMPNDDQFARPILRYSTQDERRGQHRSHGHAMTYMTHHGFAAQHQHGCRGHDMQSPGDHGMRLQGETMPLETIDARKSGAW